MDEANHSMGQGQTDYYDFREGLLIHNLYWIQSDQNSLYCYV